MAHQQQQGEQTRQGEQVLDADLAQHLGLLDWSQLDPILGEGQALTGAENEPGFFDDFGDDLLEDEGTEEQSEFSEEDRDDVEEEKPVHRRRGGSSDDQVAAPVVTTGHQSRSPSQGGRGLTSVTTGHVASGRGKNVSGRTRSRGRTSASLSGSSVCDTQAQGPSTEPTDPSASGESKGKSKKRKSAPNLDEIEDPAERRKQRRLAKNRATAAVSRERKRVQMVQLAGRTRALEQENANLQFMLGLRDQEIARLRQEFVSFPRGAGSLESSVTAATSPTEPAALTGAALLIHPPGSSDALGPPAAVELPPPERPEGGVDLGVDLGATPGLRGSISGEQIGPGEQGGSWGGSTQNSRSLPNQPGVLVTGHPASVELVGRGASTNIPGVVVGVDGQWLRLRRQVQPVLLPSPGLSRPGPSGTGRGASGPGSL